MKLAMAVWTLLFTGLAYAQPPPVPKEWWKNEVSVQEVESADQQWRTDLVERLHASGSRDANGKSIDSESVRRIEEFSRSSIKDNEGWVRIKSMLGPGDLLYEFAAPPLSGPMGYVLVRDGVAIDAITTADQ